MTKNKLKKEHFEILLEEIRNHAKLALEGHSVLDKKIDDVKEMVREVDIKVEDTREALKYTRETLSTRIDKAREELSSKVDKIDQKLDQHIHMPASLAHV